MADLTRNLDRLVGLGRTFTFNGATFEFSPLPLSDMARMRAFTADFVAARAKELVAKMKAAGAPEEHMTAIWTEAAAAMRNPLKSGAMEEPEVLQEMMFLSLTRKHPDLTRERAMEIMSSPGVLEQLLGMVNDLNDASDLLGNEQGASPTTLAVTSTPGPSSSGT